MKKIQCFLLKLFGKENNIEENLPELNRLLNNLQIGGNKKERKSFFH